MKAKKGEFPWLTRSDPDLEEWGEPSLETFESLPEADDAGREAMKIAARQR